MSHQVVLWFITYLSNQRLLARTIKVYLAGVRAWFISSGMQPPVIYSEAAKLALKSLDRIQPEPHQVHPLTKDLIHKLLVSLAPTHDNFMYATAILTAYFACLRSAEYCYNPQISAPLLIKAIKFYRGNPPYFVMSVNSSKNAIKGFRAVVGCSTSILCAHCSMAAFISAGSLQPHNLLFTTQSGQPLTYLLLNNFIKQSMYRLGYDQTKFTPHSIRAGSATDAALAGMPASTIKSLGRWRSDTYMQYLRPHHQQLATLAPMMTGASPPQLHLHDTTAPRNPSQH